MQREPLRTFHQRAALLKPGEDLPDPKDVGDALALLEQRVQELERVIYETEQNRKL